MAEALAPDSYARRSFVRRWPSTGNWSCSAGKSVEISSTGSTFGEAWPDEAIVQAVLAQITWYHNLAVPEKLATPEDRIWYAKAAIQHGWSRNVPVHQIGDRNSLSKKAIPGRYM
jgi:hypothetical protein